MFPKLGPGRLQNETRLSHETETSAVPRVPGNPTVLCAVRPYRFGNIQASAGALIQGKPVERGEPRPCFECGINQIYKIRPRVSRCENMVHETFVKFRPRRR
jgi:hypothetical protein